MKYYGIKTPGEYSYIYWITESEWQSWQAFFNIPDKFNNSIVHRLPMSEAIEAYKAIGYKCVELEVTERGETKSAAQILEESLHVGSEHD